MYATRYINVSFLGIYFNAGMQKGMPGYSVLSWFLLNFSFSHPLRISADAWVRCQYLHYREAMRGWSA